jgi:nucleoside-diphosphate-sugar epimerase
MEAKHVIFGFGPVGRTLATRLVASGESVRIVSRRGTTIPGAEGLAADATNSSAARTAVRGAQVVYNCTNADYAQWPTLLPPLFAGILAAAVAEGAKYVYTDNLYMYGPVAGPMTEDLPNRAAGPKGALRAQLADDVRRAKIPTVIVRASDFFGPFVESALLGSPTLRAIQAKKAVPVIGNPDMPHAFTYMPDLAATLEIAGRDDRANGQIWHAPTLEAISTREMVARFGDLLGERPKLMVAGRPILTVLGLFNPLMRTLKETLYQWESPYRLDSRRFQSTFGLRPTPLDQALRETVAALTPLPS